MVTEIWVNIGSGNDLHRAFIHQIWIIVKVVLWHSIEADSQEMTKLSILDMSLKLTDSRLQQHFSRNNDLNLIDVHGAKCPSYSETTQTVYKHDYHEKNVC